MAMTRKVVNWTWEDEDAQKAFAEWCPLPDEDHAVQYVDQIERFLDMSPQLDILDVGCGNGRYAIELAKRGHTVVGIDVAKLFLDDAMSFASQAGVLVDFRLQRGSELREIEAFDVALALAHVIGFMNRDEIGRHFTAICRALRPDGVLLYTFQGPRHIPSRELGPSRPVKNWREKDGRFIVSEKSYQDGYRDEHCIVIDTNTDEIVEYREHQRAVGFNEVVAHLKQAGFSSVEAFKNFYREPATKEDFTVFVCRKQEMSNQTDARDG